MTMHFHYSSIIFALQCMSHHGFYFPHLLFLPLSQFNLPSNASFLFCDKPWFNFLHYYCLNTTFLLPVNLLSLNLYFIGFSSFLLFVLLTVIYMIASLCEISSLYTKSSLYAKSSLGVISLHLSVHSSSCFFLFYGIFLIFLFTC